MIRYFQISEPFERAGIFLIVAPVPGTPKNLN